MKATNLQKALLALRFGVFLVMFMWTVDKFVNPEHSAKIFSKFYMIDGMNNLLVYIAGVLQLIVVFAFLLGIKKRWSYGAIFLFHGVSTFSSYAKYFDPWKSLLFFAAWPMLAAIYALYIMRDEDTLLTIK